MKFACEWDRETVEELKIKIVEIHRSKKKRYFARATVRTNRRVGESEWIGIELVISETIGARERVWESSAYALTGPTTLVRC